MNTMKNFASMEDLLNSFNVTHPDTPEDVLLKLARNEDTNIRLSVAERDYLPESVIRVLCEDENTNVIRATLLGATKVPDDVLIRLAHPTQKIVVVTAIAQHHGEWGGSEEVLSALLQDTNNVALRSVAEFCDIPPNVVKKFIDMETEQMWQSLMMNVKFFPVEAVEELWIRNRNTKNFEEVNHSAITRLSTDKRTTVRMFKRLVGYKKAATHLPQNSACPVHLIERLAEHENLHPEVQRRIVERLAADAPKFAGMPVEWVEATLFGKTS